MKPRAISTPVLAFASLLAAAGGCGEGGLATPPQTGAGGSGVGGAGGSGGSGGSAGTADTGAGGSAGTANAGGSAGTADAGTGGSAGAPDAGAPDAPGGAGGGFATDDGVLCPRPAQALITDFTYVAGGDGTTTAVRFGNSSSFSGTEYVYPVSGAWPVTSDVTGNSWHISGTLGDYSGFGLVFDRCSRVDASAYRGISFTISGSVPQGSAVTMGVGTLNDTIASSWLNAHGGDGSVRPGRCIPTTGTNQYSQFSCVDAAAAISIPAVPTVKTILWNDFSGGRPEPGVTPSDILTVYWFFPPPAGVGTASPAAYPVDIVIDNLAFVP